MVGMKVLLCVMAALQEHVISRPPSGDTSLTAIELSDRYLHHLDPTQSDLRVLKFMSIQASSLLPDESP